MIIRTRLVLVLVLLVLSQLCAALFAGAGEARSVHPSLSAARVLNSAGSWGSAKEIPGTATLNAGGSAEVGSVSCASAGNCVAGGFYRDGSGNLQAFVVDEVNGTWGRAKEVPGTATLNAGGDAQVNSVSCASAGNCVAGGDYFNRPGKSQAFVVTEVSGTWGRAQKVPGTATLNTGGEAQVNSVSCASAGNCVAGGYYADGSGNSQAFVVTEVSGTWGSAQEVPGTATLNAGGDAQVDSVSCASAGDCAAGGFYTDGSGNLQALVVTEVSGTWGSAQEIPGTATLNAGGDAQVESVSCPSAGSCAAAGFYVDGSASYQAFVVDEASGTWGSAEEVPGTATLNAGGSAEVGSVSCASAGNCVAGGYYMDGSGNLQAFVVDEVSGTWGSAEEVPGTATLNAGGSAGVNSVSCSSAGNCVAGGDYKYGSGPGLFQAFVVGELNGRWGSAKEVPGMATLNAGGDAVLASVSCTPAGGCAGGGEYTDGSGNLQAFVVDSKPPAVSSFMPTSGITGSTVTIGGSNFVPGMKVMFGTKVAASTFVSTTQIQAVVPNGAVTAPVSVTSPSGTGTSSTSFGVTLSITGLSPPSGAPGTVVTITGVGFNSSSTVEFNATAASSVTFVSSGKLQATVPTGASSGPITVINTTTPAGTVHSRAAFIVT